MTLSLICRNRDVETTGEDEDALVAAAQVHHASAHVGDHAAGHRPPGGGPHTASRDPVLVRLRHHRRHHGTDLAPGEPDGIGQ
ncbi:hypothetical protein [Actinacidiphila acidipaludis]|uniref:Uncharacterized protein n=1 Tax=Actinacidiphila acidipaludis TaxID=2873382 RepID=A0ABS7QDH4_9ACTN|nr:hypothetical protein [Streptomyces acidipaludis]MBY8880007.1 hypothetical protein [Streptomyces acidipaludis]